MNFYKIILVIISKKKKKNYRKIKLIYIISFIKLVFFIIYSYFFMYFILFYYPFVLLFLTFIFNVSKKYIYINNILFSFLCLFFKIAFFKSDFFLIFIALIIIWINTITLISLLYNRSRTINTFNWIIIKRIIQRFFI